MDEIEIRRIDLEAKQRRIAWALGLSGLIPFVATALLVLVLGGKNPLGAPTVEIFRTYSVVILSFLGGIRWGYALVDTRDDERLPKPSILVASVLPSLLAWATMFLPITPAVGILLLGFCAQGAWDSWSANADRLPKWFAPLRMVLTLVVAAAHIVVLLTLLA